MLGHLIVFLLINRLMAFVINRGGEFGVFAKERKDGLLFRAIHKNFGLKWEKTIKDRAVCHNGVKLFDLDNTTIMQILLGKYKTDTLKSVKFCHAEKFVIGHNAACGGFIIQIVMVDFNGQNFCVDLCLDPVLNSKTKPYLEALENCIKDAGIRVIPDDNLSV